MNDEQLAIFLLLSLHADGEIGCSEARLLQRAIAEGWPRLTLPELQVTLRELANSGWVLSWKPKLAGWRWKLAEQGVLVLREKNLA
ncbi:hypothetical protein [Opitutus terrae]|uniref:Uncharacterized protein n=1 Tax=Opitutus terrae (strain DSM 11246 / JCM 15787 / PB90-1) TaxID=452637 RepID=B1ZU81_OPITP|nr:hypothetical protein [Opitutus terrae]ACB76690.1 hypothetical protein Oter_3413 [Opitutus terrae PB90-1]